MQPWEVPHPVVGRVLESGAGLCWDPPDNGGARGTPRARMDPLWALCEVTGDDTYRQQSLPAPGFDRSQTRSVSRAVPRTARFALDPGGVSRHR